LHILSTRGSGGRAQFFYSRCGWSPLAFRSWAARYGDWLHPEFAEM